VGYPLKQEAIMADDEIDFHRTRIIESKTLLDEFEAGNQAGAEVFPETQEIERLKAQIEQSRFIVTSHEKTA
jgi:hypothetical protein